MTASDTLLERLRTHVPLFQDFAPEEVRHFVSLTRKHATKPGAVVIKEGEAGEAMFIIVAGEFEVYRNLATGPWQLLARLHPGETFGELALVDNEPRSATVLSTGNGMLLEFQRGEVDRLAASAIKLYRNLARIVSSRLRQTDRLISLAIRPAAADAMEFEATRLDPAVTRRG